MNFDQLISYFEPSLDPSTPDTNHISQSDTSALQPLTQSSCATSSLSLLKAFCSSEETVKHYLQNDESDNQDNEQLFFSPLATLGSFVENRFRYDRNNLPVSPSVIDNLFPPSISSYISTDPRVIEFLYQSRNNNTYDNLKLNFIFLVERGYKLTLSLNTDNSEVDEPWNPDVSQKILSVCFSSLSLKSEYLSNDLELDGFESLLMAEACAAFKGKKNLNLFSNLNDRRRAKASPDKLISICKGIKGYRKIEISDKIILLSSIYNHLHAMDSIINYDPTIDGWDTPASDFKFDRRDLFLFNQFLHDGVAYVIETFPDRFRNDINVIILLYLIIIFNADAGKLKYPEIIRHEQYSYIYLLRRYLRTIYKSDCEASDNHYRLMNKIEQLRLLVSQAEQEFFHLLTEPLMETITKAITINANDIAL